MSIGEIKETVYMLVVGIPTLLVLICFARCTPEKLESNGKKYECTICNGTGKKVLDRKKMPSIISFPCWLLETFGFNIVTGECEYCHGEGYVNKRFDPNVDLRKLSASGSYTENDANVNNNVNIQSNVTSGDINNYQPNGYDNSGYDNSGYDDYAPRITGHYETTTERCIECLGKGYIEQMIFHGGGEPNTTIQRWCPFCRGTGTVTKREYVIDYE